MHVVDRLAAAVTTGGSTMNPAFQPYLFFRGRCSEAIDYYKKTLGAEEVMVMRFKDSPEKPPPGRMPAGMADRVMHASLRIAGAELMLSDGMRSGATDFDCVAVSLTVPNETDVDRICNALAKDGKVQMPPGPTFFAKRFGGVVDKFGVNWMILVPQAHA
jgi:PhnB protein